MLQPQGHASSAAGQSPGASGQHVQASQQGCQRRCMDGVERNNVFIFGCTNCPWDIDEAFMRRFKRRILIDLPHPAQSFHLLLRQLQHSGLELSQPQADRIVERLGNYSGSDIDSVARMVKHYPLDELIMAKEFHINDDG